MPPIGKDVIMIIKFRKKLRKPNRTYENYKVLAFGRGGFIMEGSY